MLLKTHCASMKNIPDNRILTKLKPFSSTGIIKSNNQRFKRRGCIKDSDAFYRQRLNIHDLFMGCTPIDIVCNEDHLGRLSLERGIKSFSVDRSAVALANHKLNVSENQVCIAVGHQFLFPTSAFDNMKNLGSLEDFKDPMMGFSKMDSNLKSNRKIALQMLNLNYLVDILGIVFRTGNPPNPEQWINRCTAWRELQSSIENARFRILKAHKQNLCVLKSINDHKWHLKYPRKITNLLDAPLVLFALSNSFFFSIQEILSGNRRV